ncbi:MAG: PLDc N-terminal domain-containing protein [Phycisphaerales bacterium]
MLYNILGLIHLILFIIAAVEIIKSGMDPLKKVLWLLVIFLFPLIGLIIYFLIGRGK